MRKPKPSPMQDKILSQIEYIKDLYYNQKISFTQIEKITNFPVSSVRRVFKKLGLQSFVRTVDTVYYRKYKVNENYFEQINTPEKAYWLGFLYTDGCNYKSKKRAGVVIFSLQAQDKDAVFNLKKALDSEHPISFVKKGGGQYRLSISSGKLSRDLVKLGCIPAKSKILQFPTFDQVPKHLMRHFLRGCVDGDGSIMCTNKKRRTNTIGFTGSAENFIDGFIKYVFDNTGVLFRKYMGNFNGWELKIGGRLGCIKFLDWLYEESEGLRLERKYNKYLEIKNNILPKKEKVLIKKVCKNKTGFWGLQEINGKFSVLYGARESQVYLGFFEDKNLAAFTFNSYSLMQPKSISINVIPGLEFV